MERIKLALDRARQQAAVNGTTNAPVARSAHPGVSPTAVAATAARAVILDRAHLEDHRIVAFDQSHPSRWAFDLLRTQVLQKMGEKGWKTIAVTSPSANSGKTVVAVNLAMSIAHHPEHSATLVDFDFRRPRIAEYLGIPDGASVPEVLRGESNAHECAVDVGVAGLRILPTYHGVAGASELISCANAVKMIKEYRTTEPGAVTVFDLPPVTAVDDVIAILPHIDCVLLVVGNGNSTKREIEEAQRHLARFPVVGTVLNKAIAPVRNVGYYG